MDTEYILKKISVVTILILIDGFLQFSPLSSAYPLLKCVTILILIDGFLQYNMNKYLKNMQKVTILILIDGFLQ